VIEYDLNLNMNNFLNCSVMKCPKNITTLENN
jgi:hypothetical protein